MMKSKAVMVPGIAALAALLAFGLAGAASAFHGGGVAHCDGCHSMHNSPDNPISGAANNTLLKGSDPSSTCLNCHQGAGSATSYHIKSTDGSVWSPGGDFFWLTQSYSYSVRGTPHTSDPDNVGHNIIATDYTLAVDGTNSAAPGGTYPAGDLGCDSCHDPHGQVNGGGTAPISVSGSYGAEPPAGTIAGNYRLLGDVAYGRAAAPIAVISDDSAAPGGKYGEQDDHHVAYGSNMSEWCASCHGTYINDSHKHPAGNGEQLGQDQVDNYNAYIATGDLNNVDTDSYLALVPFEIGEEATTADLLGRSLSKQGPDTNSNVMCLTCHRAHASAFNNITRWDMETELLVDSLPGATELTAMGAVPNAAYYGRVIATDFGEYQRSLCNKCHIKD